MHIVRGKQASRFNHGILGVLTNVVTENEVQKERSCNSHVSEIKGT